MIRAGYSATIWDGARSGIGTYIAEQLDVLENDPEIALKILTSDGDVLPSDKRPDTGATGHGIGKSSPRCATSFATALACTAWCANTRST